MHAHAPTQWVGWQTSAVFDRPTPAKGLYKNVQGKEHILWEKEKGVYVFEPPYKPCVRVW